MSSSATSTIDQSVSCMGMLILFKPEPEFLKFLKEPKNRFQGTNSAWLGSLTSRYDNPIPLGSKPPKNV